MTERRQTRIPSYRLHRPSGLGVVTLSGRDFYLGRHGTPESRAEYERMVGEWLAAGRTIPGCARRDNGSTTTVDALILAYWHHCQCYYVKDGQPTSEQALIRVALRYLRPLYGHTLADEFSPLALRAYEQALVDRGLARRTILSHCSRVKRMFRWAVENELAPPRVHHGLSAVSGLRKGRSGAREPEPIKPVDDAHIAAVEPYVSRQVWAMIRLQLLTAARPGELIGLRSRDIDMSSETWVHRPDLHKTSHHGKTREIYFGPRAQMVLRPFLADRDSDLPLFSPLEAEQDRRQQVHLDRVTPASCGNKPGSNRKRRPKVAPGKSYSRDSYRRAIRRACQKAGVPIWTPHRLRHNAATMLRDEFGLEVASVVLGHSSMVVTQIYAEENKIKAMRAIRKVG